MGELKGFYLMPHAPILIPEISDTQIKNVKSTFDACYRIASDIADIEPDTIIILTPHGTLNDEAIALSTDEAIYGNFESYGQEQLGMECKIEKNLTETIYSFALQNNIPIVKINKNSAKVYGAPLQLDDGTMVPLYFINKKFTRYKLVNITYPMLSKLELYKFGMVIRRAVEASNNKAILIASGDLSHCLNEDETALYDEDREKFDRKLINLLESGKVLDIFNMEGALDFNACECGLKSCYIMFGTLSEYNITGKLFSYEGPFSAGYCVMKIEAHNKTEDISGQIYKSYEEALEKKQNHPNLYIRLARQSIAYFLRNSQIMNKPDYITNEMLNNKKGVFVSLKKNGRLRGCIGTINPVNNNVADEIIKNSILAATEDPRFMPVKENELIEIDVSIDILEEPILTTREELNPKRYGIIVKTENKTGLLLPNLEDINTIDEQIEIALRKAGILKDEEYKLYRFEVVRHKE